MAYHEKDIHSKVEIISAYVKACLEFAEHTEHVEEFQICHYYEKLTILLVKLKRWQDAKDNLDKMYSLPSRFFERSCPSAQAKLKKRLERCNKILKI